MEIFVTGNENDSCEGNQIRFSQLKQPTVDVVIVIELFKK